MTISLLDQQQSGIQKHAELLLEELKAILPKAGGKYFFEWAAFQGLTADLSCSSFSTLRALRQRGGNVPIVPLFETDSNEFNYWLSLHQEWVDSPTLKSKGLAYNTTSLTVFFGSSQSVDKVQLFRAEWAGVRLKGDKTLGFEAQGAGHPHWQCDAYQRQAIQLEAERKRLGELANTLQDLYDEQDFAESVTAELMPGEIAELSACLDRLTRIHFASLANWPITRWDGDNTNVAAHARGRRLRKRF